MGQFEVREFTGSDGVVYPALDTTSLGAARHLDVRLLEVLNEAPAWLTQSERLLLFTLAYTLRPARYLEIGILHGGASLIVSKAMDAAGHDGRMFLVDPEPRIDPIHWDQMRERASLFQGRSPEVLPEVGNAAGGPFDMVFIDADHSATAVMRDGEGVLPFLADGAYLVFHDSFRREVGGAIDRFTHLHPASVVDFGTLTREFHTSDSKGREGDSRRFSCGMRVLQLRKRHGRARILNYWRGGGERLRRALRRVRQLLRS